MARSYLIASNLTQMKSDHIFGLKPVYVCLCIGGVEETGGSLIASFI